MILLVCLSVFLSARQCYKWNIIALYTINGTHLYICTRKGTQYKHVPVADPGFSEGEGAPTSLGERRQLPMRLHFENFVCQRERIWTLGARAGSAPWIRQCVQSAGRLAKLSFCNLCFDNKCHLAKNGLIK